MPNLEAILLLLKRLVVDTLLYYLSTSTPKCNSDKENRYRNKLNCIVLYKNIAEFKIV